METFILALHAVGAGVVLAIVLISVVFALKEPLSRENLNLLLRIRNWGTYAVIFQVLSGLYLFFQKFEHLKSDKIFWIKMVLFAIDGLTATAVIRKKLKRASAGQEELDSQIKRVQFWTLVSLLIVISIILLGIVLTESH